MTSTRVKSLPRCLGLAVFVVQPPGKLYEGTVHNLKLEKDDWIEGNSARNNHSDLPEIVD